jgi:lipopolysaccharide transport system permease protein
MTKKNNKIDHTIDSNNIQREYIKDILRYRELFYFLAWRDIVVRYKQTFFGVIWAVIRPLLTMAVFVFVFGKVAKLGSVSTTYPLFVLSGLLPWILFSSSLAEASNSLVLNATMISKIYFPRIILPISNIAVHFIDFIIGFFVLIVLLLFQGELNHFSVLAFPIFILSICFLCLGAGLWLSAISVRYRDFRFIVPFLIQFGIFISPVGYSSFLIPEAYQWIFFLNPMVGIIEGFRWCCFGVADPQLFLAIGLSFLVNSLLLVSGFLFFRKMENICADII